MPVVLQAQNNNLVTFNTLAPGGGANAATDDAVRLIVDKLLRLEERDSVFARDAMKVSLPQHNSKTIQFSRYPRIALPQQVLIEGKTPELTPYGVETVFAVMDQWGMVVGVSDLAEITIKHPQMPILTNLLGKNLTELVDREVYRVLAASPSVSFANGKASRALLTGSDTVDSTDLRKIFSVLRRNGAAKWGTTYRAIVDTEVSQDIQAEDKFHTRHELRDVANLDENMIGTWMGFAFRESNMIPGVSLIDGGDWTAASDSSGAWAGGSVTVNVKITAVDNQFGYEEQVAAAKAVAMANGEKLNITMPTLTGFTYNIYASSVTASALDSNMRLVSSGHAPAAVFDLTTVVTTLAEIAAASSTLPPANPPAGVVVHTSFFYGKDAYAKVDLAGDNLKVYITDKKPSDSDPLAQRRKIGYKGSFKSLVLNHNFLRRLESASAFDT